MSRCIVRFCLWPLAVMLFAAADVYGPPQVRATIQVPGLRESSGLAASRRQAGVFWSHNDSGDGPYLYAFDSTGKNLGRWTVANARNYDWEDLSIGPGPVRGKFYLYIGDIGDNKRKRSSITVYRVPEPDVSQSSRETGPAEVFQFRYPGEAHDAEALLVHPRSGDVYIVTKAKGSDDRTGVYVAPAPLQARRPVTLKHLADLKLPGQSAFTLITGRITGGAVSPDGRRVFLCDYFRGWEATLPPGTAEFRAIWQQTWQPVDLGTRVQGEAVAYSPDGRAVLATSEGKMPPLIEAVRKR